MFRIAKMQMARDLNRWIAAALIIYLFFSIVIVQLGIERFKAEEKQKGQFIEVQINRVKGFINYQQYGLAGIGRLLVGAPIYSLFFNSSTFDALQARIEITTNYNVFKSEVGKNVFDRPTGGSLDFSWFLITFGSALLCLWCFFSLRNREYLKFLRDFGGRKQVWGGIVLGRSCLVTMTILIIHLAAAVQYLVNGIALPAGQLQGLFISFGVAALMMLILTGLASGCGAIRNWKFGAPLAAVIWVLLVLIWPEGLNSIFMSQAQISMKTIEEQQIKKDNLLLPFEKEALKNTGRFETIQEKTESDRKSAEHYWDVVSPQILAIDKENVAAIVAMASEFHKWSILNPVTFYKSVNNELGGKGFNAYSRFYNENLEIQRRFLRHVFDKRFYENYTKVEPFLPASALVVQSQSSQPGYFTEGLIFIFFCLALAYGFCYIMYMISMYPAAMAPGGYGEVNIEAEYGLGQWILCPEDDLEDQMYNVLSGHPRRGFNGRLVVGNENLVNKVEKEFVFIPNTSKIPGHFTVEFVVDNLGRLGKIPKEVLMRFKGEKKDQLKKKFKELDPAEQTVLVLDLCGLKEPRIYFIGKLGNPGKKQFLLTQKIQQLKEKGAFLLYLADCFAPDKSYTFYYENKKYELLKAEKTTSS